MNDATNITQAAPARAEAGPDARWSATRAVLLGWLRPGTTAANTKGLPLRRAYGVHLAALLAVPPILLVYNVLLGHRGPITPSLVLQRIGTAVDSIASHFRLSPFRTMLAVVGVWLAVELAHLLLALLVTAWGARDEPLRHSYRNALRQVWLRSSHIVVCALVIAAVAVTLTQMDRAWSQRHHVPQPSWPRVPINAAPGSPADLAYQQAVQDYWPKWREWRATRMRLMPKYLFHAEILIAQTVLANIAWFLWAMLRAVGAPRATRPIARPPTCEACGYNLTMIPPEGRCPECAEPIAASLGPEARRGPPWQRRGSIGRMAAWWSTARVAIADPTALGRRLRTTDPGTDHRWFLAMTLPPIFVFGATAMVGIFLIDEGLAAMRRDIVPMSLVVPVVGCLCCLGTIGVTLGSTLVIGLPGSLSEKRNLLPGTMQVACYLGGYLVAWAVFGAVTLLGAVYLDHLGVFQLVQSRWKIDREIAAAMAWMLPNIACGLWYLALLSRGMAGTRHANR